jgi:hypothetical protein
LAKATRATAGAVVAVKLGAAEQRRPWSECGRHGWRRCSDKEADGWALTVSDFFLNLSKTGSNAKIKMGALLALKIPNFCMWLAWDIMNNFLSCTDIKFQAEKDLKILEQIQYLNLWWIKKRFKPSGKIW